MNPFLDPETQTYCPSCLQAIGQTHTDECQNHPFNNPAAAQKLLAWTPTKEDLDRQEILDVLNKDRI